MNMAQILRRCGYIHLSALGSSWIAFEILAQDVATEGLNIAH